MNSRTKLFVWILLAASVVIAVVYIIWTMNVRSIDGFYTVADSFVDSSGYEVASVVFVEVIEYDSLKISLVAKHLMEEEVSSPKGIVNKQKTMLFHFYVASDTAALTPDMIDELSYTHPNILNPADILQVVPGGWVIKSQFKARTRIPSSVEMKRSQFYKPRTGIKAKDLR